MYQLIKLKLNPFWTLTYRNHYLSPSPYRYIKLHNKITLSIPTGKMSHTHYVFQKVR